MVGAVGGSVVPGPGTVAGAAAGGTLGYIGGGLVGGSIGASAAALGTIACNAGSGGGGGGDSPQAPKLWKITDPAATRVVGGRTYLKDAKTGLWWSRDTAGHGGSAWKVYREVPGGKLNWFRDADAQGNFINPNLKWKSPVGTTIR